MAFTTDDLTVVEAAIRKLATGKRVTEVRFSDRTVQYQSATMNDLVSLRAQILSDIARTGDRRPRAFRIRHGGKGV